MKPKAPTNVEGLDGLVSWWVPGSSAHEATLVPGDFAAFGRVCPLCGWDFAGREKVFESTDQGLQVHVDCVLALARRIEAPRDVDADYEQARAELLSRLRDADE